MSVLRELFEAEQEDLVRDLQGLPRFATLRYSGFQDVYGQEKSNGSLGPQVCNRLPLYSVLYRIISERLCVLPSNCSL
jgi:hypothetical protein